MTSVIFTTNALLTGPWGTVSISGRSMTSSLPPWVEAGLFGLVIGAYIGLFLALRFRHPMARAAARLRARTLLHRNGGVKTAATRQQVVRKIDHVGDHLDQLAGTAGPHEQGAWSAAIDEYRVDLDRLRGRVE